MVIDRSPVFDALEISGLSPLPARYPIAPQPPHSSVRPAHTVRAVLEDPLVGPPTPSRFAAGRYALPPSEKSAPRSPAGVLALAHASRCACAKHCELWQ